MTLEQYWNAYQNLVNLATLCASDSTLLGQVNAAMATAKAGVNTMSAPPTPPATTT